MAIIVSESIRRVHELGLDNLEKELLLKLLSFISYNTVRTSQSTIDWPADYRGTSDVTTALTCDDCITRDVNINMALSCRFRQNTAKTHHMHAREAK